MNESNRIYNVWETCYVHSHRQTETEQSNQWRQCSCKQADADGYVVFVRFISHWLEWILCFIIIDERKMLKLREGFKKKWFLSLWGLTPPLESDKNIFYFFWILDHFLSTFWTPWRIGSTRPSASSWIEGNFLPSIQHVKLDRRQLFTFYSAVKFSFIFM